MTKKNSNDEQAVEIGRRIAQARREHGGMTQHELADLLQVSPRSVQAYETGEVIPYRVFRRIEEVLDKPVAWFLRGESDGAADTDLRRLEEKIDTLTAMVATLIRQAM